ncbi:YybH family protein [Hirschia litorea]|uniref:YybH family protein n=1 Tax=Hirschia litorea TaxID=1199156 RepID=A0ABW2ILB6_9PROT
MKRASLILGSVVLGFAILGGCATAPDPILVEQVRVAAFKKVQKQADFEIRALLKQQNAAWNNGDIDGFMKGYLPSENLRFASGDNITWGYDETLSRYKSRYDTPEKMGKISMEIQEVRVFTDTDAMVFGRWFLARPKEGDVGGLFTLILEKQAGEWLVVADHTS